MGPVKVVVAPDKFAGTMTAIEAAEAIAAGWRSARPDDEIRLVPMADGGPGTVDVVARHGLGIRRSTPSVDQRGRPVEAEWLELPNGSALVEAASVCGLHLVPEPERTPLAYTTTGLGRLLASIAAGGRERMVVGVGGTGTVDAGVGAAAALGATFRRSDGAAVEAPHPQTFPAIDSVTPITTALPEVVVATDVAAPLLGRRGSAHTFAPQKSVDATRVADLEERLRHIADLAERDLDGGPWRDVPGAGAGGGLGFGLLAWVGARIGSGAARVGELVELDRHLAWGDVVITGEGRIDHQTEEGKAPAHVAEAAGETPVAAVTGRLEPGAEHRFVLVEQLGANGFDQPTASAAAAGRRLADALPSLL